MEVAKPVIYGLAIAFLLNPIVKRVDRFLYPKLRIIFPDDRRPRQLSRSVGIFTSLLILMAVIVALCNMLLPELYSSIRDMVFKVPSQLNDLIDTLNEMNSRNTTISTILANVVAEGTDYLQKWLRNDLLRQTNVIMTNLTVGVINIVSGMLNIVIGIIVSIYVLYSKEMFSRQCKKVVYSMLKPRYANLMLHITRKSNEIFSGFIIGKIIDSMIIGVLCFIGLTVLKMPYVILVSVIVGVTNIIPFFGPYIGAIPSAILILLDEPKKGIYFVIFILVLQQLDGNVIGPKILGDSTGLSAFWVVFAILSGGGLFGIPGMILGVPTFAVIYYIITMVVNWRLELKHLPTGSSYYDELSYVDNGGKYVHSDEHKEQIQKESSEE